MKHYEKQYENVFIRNLDKRCHYDKITALDNIPGDINSYIDSFKEAFEDMHKSMFINLIKLDWLNRRFVYDGKRSLARSQNGMNFLRAKSLFIRNYVGYDPKFIFMSNSPLLAITRYFDDFFPDFLDNNPFENPELYEYPFKYMRMDALVTVGQMEERLELLLHGEENEMSLEEFKDYVVNYVSCYNEEHGPTFEFKFPGGYSTYVSVLKKVADRNKRSAKKKPKRKKRKTTKKKTVKKIK